MLILDRKVKQGLLKEREEKLASSMAPLTLITI